MALNLRARACHAALLAASLTVAGRADAYVLKRTPSGAPIRWDRGAIAFALDPALEAHVPGGRGAALEAAGAWSGVHGAPVLALDEPTRRPPPPAFDGTNGISFMEDGFAPAGSAIAITSLTYDLRTGAILDADVIVNGAYRFEVLGAAPAGAADVAPRPLAYDLQHVLAHEVGHALGMDDEMAASGALMYRYSAPNDAKLREPTTDDLAGLAALYGTVSRAEGSGCTAAPGRATHAASALACAGLVVALIFGRRRQSFGGSEDGTFTRRQEPRSGVSR